MLGKWEVGDIVVQVGVTNGVSKAKRIKILRGFQTIFFVLEQRVSEVSVEEKSAAKKVANKLKILKFPFICKQS